MQRTVAAVMAARWTPQMSSNYGLLRALGAQYKKAH